MPRLLTRLLTTAVVAVAATGWRGPCELEAQTRGSVAGDVIVRASPPPPPTPLSPYARRRYQPPQNPGVPGGAEDAFVYLEPLDGSSAPAPTGSVQILQRDRTIIPHVSVAQVGQIVEFPNGDDVFHNLFSLSAKNRFNLGRYPPGSTETNVFENSGVVRLFCDIHAEMAGWILVVSTPYVARVNADGSYRVAGVPPGRYRAIAWHPTAGADTATVSVPATPELVQDFALLGAR